MKKDRVLEILNSNDLKAQSKFGQNFLCNDEITERIVDVSDIRPDSRVLEIGPGLGALTEAILHRSNGEMQYKAIEIDRGLVEYLENEPFIGLNALIDCADFTKLKREDYVEYHDFDFVVSNIPYYVMAPIIKKLLIECGTAEKMTFMVEQDAIERIVAKPDTKQYGPLAVLCAVYGKVNKEFSVPADCFYPAPHTLSAVITLTKKITFDDDDIFVITPEFSKFLDSCFSMRRKTLYNCLSTNFGSFSLKMSILNAIEKLGYNTKVRAESIKPDDFVELYKLLLL